MVDVLFRFDDYAYWKNRNETERLSVTQRALRTFREYGLTHIVGVVPELSDETGNPRNKRVHRLDESPARMAGLENILRSETGFIALHGHTHQQQSWWNRSEFAGVPRSEQKQKIRRGRQLLSSWTGTDPDLFIPPWNKLDLKTLDLLETFGFSIVSTWLPNHKFICQQSGLVSLPQCYTPRHLRSRLEESCKDLSVVVVVLHDYEFREVNPETGVISVEQLEEIGRWIADHPSIQSCSPYHGNLCRKIHKDYAYEVYLTRLLQRLRVGSPPSTRAELSRLLVRLDPLFTNNLQVRTLRKIVRMIGG